MSEEIRCPKCNSEGPFALQNFQIKRGPDKGKYINIENFKVSYKPDCLLCWHCDTCWNPQTGVIYE